MSNPLTQVNPKYFSEMKTDQGITVEELSNKGCKVLLYFINSVGCAFCQNRIEELFNLYESLTKLNVVPILLYNDDSKDYKDFIQKNTRSDNYDIFLSMEQKELKNVFKIKPVNVLKVLMTKHFFTELKRLEKIGIFQNKTLMDKVSLQLASAFLIYKNQIISEYRPETPDERFDWTKIVIDPENFGISLSSASILECEYIPKRKKEEKKTLFKKVEKDVEKEEKIEIIKGKSESLPKEVIKPRRRRSFFERPKEEEPEIEITLKTVLENEQYRKYFKIQLTKEFSVENLLFYEEVQLFKALKEENRPERSLKMIDTFFKSNSIHEINTTKDFIKEIVEAKDKSDPNLFNNVELEVYQSCFVDGFKRFKTSELFKEMTSKKKRSKSSYLL